MKKAQIYAFAFLCAFFIGGAPLAHADTDHPQCDRTVDPAPGGPWNGQAVGCTSALGENLTLYSFEVYVDTNAGGYAIVSVDGVPQFPGSPLGPGTGYNTIQLVDPIVATSTQTVTVGLFSSDANSVVINGTTIKGFPYTTASNIYRVLNWSPTGDGNPATHILDVVEPSSFSTTTSPVAISFIYQQGETQKTNGYRLNFVNRETRATLSLVEYPGWSATPGTYSYSTSTPLASGSYDLTVSLIDGSPDDPNALTYTIDTFSGRSFGVGVSTVYGITTTTFGPSYQSYASSSCVVNFIGSDFNLANCLGYIFIPGSDSFSAYASLPPLLGQRAPFSYFYSIANTWSNLEATDGNAPTFEYELGDIGLGSTTPMGNILPNFTVFSASTTEEYFPEGTFDALKNIVSVALILGTFSLIFFEVRKKFAHAV